MTIKERLEADEKKNLSEFATLSANSKGREVSEDECDIRTVFQRDRDRILHSKSFRRLKDKTQVFLAPDGDHYRTRLTHTLEVSQNARTIAKSLRLNEELVEAIALGHDLGHTPFGHAGERALDSICPLGFKHNEQSLRMVEVLEKDGQGLNLTWEVRDGIVNHQMESMPSTLEGRVVRFSDKIAYIHHDMDDAIRAGILTEEDVPAGIREILGATCGDRLDHFIHDIVTNSLGKNDICMSPETEEAMTELRRFMFRRVYQNPLAKGEEGKAEEMIENLYKYYLQHIDKLPDYLLELEKKGEYREKIVCDYVAAMTDHFAMSTFEEIFIPKSWHY
ncbi:MAG: deoxyguanosinetriphosphate triphosphohydrolase [Lachnospiraceae bacterium]|nr:deoxyguanosinetriphosphate triphosphohydrolase [Candidatus Merdinaster equi]